MKEIGEGKAERKKEERGAENGIEGLWMESVFLISTMDVGTGNKFQRGRYIRTRLSKVVTDKRPATLILPVHS